jgi:hypothetical protein
VAIQAAVPLFEMPKRIIEAVWIATGLRPLLLTGRGKRNEGRMNRFLPGFKPQDEPEKSGFYFWPIKRLAQNSVQYPNALFLITDS